MYIDGWNLHISLTDAGLKNLLWLNIDTFSNKLVAIAKTLIGTDLELEYTKYFTSKLLYPKADLARQVTFLNALKVHCKTEVIEGRFDESLFTCEWCESVWSKQVEKMTDVAIATEMVSDASAHAFDVSIIVTADSDQCPPIQKIRMLYPATTQIVAIPLGRKADRLKLASGKAFKIPEASLQASQFPDMVSGFSNQYPFCRPGEWK